MATVILVRHGRSTANSAGILAGRSAGIGLDETGRDQAASTAKRLAAVPIAGLVSSPMERCRETSNVILDHQAEPMTMLIDGQITECDYGDWQGRTIAELYKNPLWPVVQSTPSAVEFPGGESMVGMQARAVEAVRRHDAAFESQHGPDAVWVAVSHGDIIKSVVADALGLELDRFQRINIAPASVSIVRYSTDRTVVLTTGARSGDLSWLAPTRS